MSKKRSRIEHLRTPFVVTVALATSACGGTATEGSGHDGNGGTRGNPPPPGPTYECPVQQPMDGSECNYTGTEPCSYSLMPDAYFLATCEGRSESGGAWHVRLAPSTYSPPPIVCPEKPPDLGTPCDGPWGVTMPDCVYGGANCYSDPETHYRCAQTKYGTQVWTTSPGGLICSPPDAGAPGPSPGDGGIAPPGDGSLPFPG